MRIAFVCEDSNGMESIVSKKFGRASYFIIVDVEDGNVKDVKTIPNPGAVASGGAAIKAVQELINQKVDVVVAGAFGPNATVALQETGIKYFIYSDIPVKEALEKVLNELKS